MPMHTGPDTIDDLGIQGSLQLAALLATREQRVPLAPTTAASWQVIERLSNLGLVYSPGPDPHAGPGYHYTPMEALPWRFTWSAYIEEQLLPALLDFLRQLDRDEPTLDLRVSAWRELALWEAQSFLEDQLQRHHFDPAWARDLSFVYYSSQPELSIGQWRYVGWAAVRHGASVAQRLGANASERIREGIFTQLQSRTSYARGSAWAASFGGPPGLPRSSISRIFVRDLCSLDQHFWTAPPGPEHLFLGRSNST